MKCPECREPMTSARENYSYTASGLPYVTLVGVEVRRCKACGEHEVVIPRIEQQTSLFRLVCLAVFCGGVGRVVAWVVTGSPGPAFLVVTVIELLIPVLIPWQALVAAQAGVDASTVGSMRRP